MKHTSILALALLGATILSTSAFAQATPPEPKVTFKMTADMATLRGGDNDVFDITLSDAQMITNFKVTCLAAKGGFAGIGRQARQCAVTGLGQIVNNGAVLGPRTDYSGSYTVEADGTTEASTLTVGYRIFGQVPPSNATFGGSLNLKPSVTSTGASKLKDTILGKIGVGENGLSNDSTDTVDLKGFTIPSAGYPTDLGCTWNGNEVYTYANLTWYIDTVANCKTSADPSGKDQQLLGNMAWVDGENNQATYFLNLTVPNGTSLGDDALFAAGGNDALFAAVNGITGQLVMDQSSFATVTIDGEEIEAASKMTVNGTFTGTGVPLEFVRSFATIIAAAPQTYFGP